MPTVKVPRDVTSQEVAEVLRNGLDGRYQVLPGTRMPRSPLFGRPLPGGPELIMVAASSMVRAQVTIVPGPRPGSTDLRVTPSGVLGDLLMNTFGIARQVRQALLDAPGLQAG